MVFPSRIDPTVIGDWGLQVIEEQGWEEWSLRDVARKFGVTPNALYRYVDDKNGLLIEIGASAARALLKSMDKCPKSQDPRKSVLWICNQYLDFAFSRPHAYRAFMTSKPTSQHPALREWRNVWLHLHRQVEKCVPQAADAAGFAIWSYLHGRIELSTGAAIRAKPKAGVKDAVLAMLAGFEAHSPVNSPLPTDIGTTLQSGH